MNDESLILGQLAAIRQQLQIDYEQREKLRLELQELRRESEEVRVSMAGITSRYNSVTEDNKKKLLALSNS
jgi:hypothetical protein